MYSFFRPSAPPDRRSEGNGWRGAYTRLPPAGTLTLLLVLLAVFLYATITTQSFVVYGPVCNNTLVWQLYQYAFYHLEVFHVLVVLAMVWPVGAMVERSIGTFSFIGLAYGLFPVGVGALTMGANVLLYPSTDSSSESRQVSISTMCVGGYSGALSAMIVIEAAIAYLAGDRTRVFNVHVYAYPVVMVLVLAMYGVGRLSLISSFMGLLVGGAYIKGLLQFIAIPRAWLLKAQGRLPDSVLHGVWFIPTPLADPMRSLYPECIRLASAQINENIQLVGRAPLSQRAGGHQLGGGARAPGAGRGGGGSASVAPLPYASRPSEYSFDGGAMVDSPPSGHILPNAPSLDPDPSGHGSSNPQHDGMLSFDGGHSYGGHMNRSGYAPLEQTSGDPEPIVVVEAIPIASPPNLVVGVPIDPSAPSTG